MNDHNATLIAAAYDAGVEEEYRRLEDNPVREFEFHLICTAIERHTPTGGSIIDIGSGPGRYAEYLLHRGYRVGLVDLSARSLKAFSDRLSHPLPGILFNQVSCATQLSWIPDQTADTLLLMGPMYHLTDPSARSRTLTHCRRILKPGGFIIAVFLCTYALNAGYSGTLPPEAVTSVLFQGLPVPQYRCNPSHACTSLAEHDFTCCQIHNIEGLSMHFSTEDLDRYRNHEAKKRLFSWLNTHSCHPGLLGLTDQFLVVAQLKK